MDNNSPFNIINKEATAVPYLEESTDGSPRERIEKMIASSSIFIFMKGTPNAPECGFSYNNFCKICNISTLFFLYLY